MTQLAAPKLAGAASPTPQVPPSSSEPQGVSDETLVIQCLDAITEQAVPSLELRARRKVDGRVVDEYVLTDDAGRVALTRTALLSVRPSPTGSWGSHISMGEVLRTGILWVVRQVPVAGKVVFEGIVEDAPYDLVQLHTLRYLALSEDGRGVNQECLREQSRLTSRGLWKVTFPKPTVLIDDEGEFELRLPRVPGGWLVARADGWRAARTQLPNTDAEFDGIGTLVLSLARAYRLEGRLVNDEGRPLPNVGVGMYTLQDGISSRHSFEAAQTQNTGPGHAFLSDGSEFMATQLHVRTDAEGRFALSLPLDGQMVRFVAHVPGHLPLRHDVGVVARDDHGIVLEATKIRGPQRRITIECEDWSLLGGEVLLLDCTDMRRQYHVKLHVDAAGTIPGEWVEQGRLYQVMISDPGDSTSVVRGYLWYDGRDVIRVDDLPKRLNDVR